MAVTVKKRRALIKTLFLAIKDFLFKFFVYLGYCSPAIVALALTIPAYYTRTQGIANVIYERAKAVQDGQIDINTMIIESEAENKILKIPKKEAALINFFYRSKLNGRLDELILKIHKKIFGIWTQYSFFIAVMTLLPFALLGTKVAFRFKRKDITLIDRWYSIRGDWWMKFIVAFTMSVGWLYTLNPLGRGGTTLNEYINTQDIFTNTTLPGFIIAHDIPIVVAGFLGWYLNLISYFISKLYYDDVYGTRVYRFLVGKLAFVYGISLVMSSLEVEQGKMAMFLVGYFPLTALSVLKEYGMKTMQGGVQEKGALIELPSISRNQILRLHEEGIDNITTLASYPRLDELKKYQHSIASMVDYWVDSARLYTIVSQKSALEIRDLCVTASEFLLRYKIPEFRKKLLDYNVKNPDEIARLIKYNFRYDSELVNIKPLKR